MAYADLKNKLDEYNWDDGFDVPKRNREFIECFQDYLKKT